MGALSACSGGPSGDDSGIDLPRRNADGNGGSRGGSGATGDAPPASNEGSPDNPTIPAPAPAPTDTATPPDPGVPCDAKDPAAGTRLFDGTLATDTKKFTAAEGFPAASWVYQAAAYQQLRLVDASDTSFFVDDAAVGNVDVVVKGASTQVSDTITPRLRQMFVLVGAKSANGSLDAYGCGAEVVQGLNPEPRTSVVKLSGPTNAVTTTAIARTARPQVLANEEFTIHARVSGGKLTCSITQGTTNTVTTAEAPVTGLTGSIGFFTRQTKAAFKTARICKLP